MLPTTKTRRSLVPPGVEEPHQSGAGRGIGGDLDPESVLVGLGEERDAGAFDRDLGGPGIGFTRKKDGQGRSGATPGWEKVFEAGRSGGRWRAGEGGQDGKDQGPQREPGQGLGWGRVRGRAPARKGTRGGVVGCGLAESWPPRSSEQLLITRPSLTSGTGRPVAVWRIWGGVDAQLGVERGGEILRSADLVRGVVAAGIGGADHVPTGHAGPGEEDGHGPGPVVASGVLVDLRSPAEFPESDHQGPVEQAAVVEVGEEGSDTLIEAFEVIAAVGVEILVW